MSQRVITLVTQVKVCALRARLVLLWHGRAVLPEDLRQLRVEVRAGEVHSADGCLNGRYHMEALADMIIPDAESSIPRAAKAETIWSGFNAGDRILMSAEYTEATAGMIIPDAEGVVIRAADAEPIWRDGDASNPILMPSEYAETFASLIIPDAEGFVV